MHDRLVQRLRHEPRSDASGIQRKDSGDPPFASMKRRLRDIGDGICCVAMVAAGAAGMLLLAFYVWHMPALF